MNLNALPVGIRDKMGRNLHLKQGHPLQILKLAILEVFQDFKVFDQIPPVVSVEENFDQLLIPYDHPSRSPSDTYYLDSKTVLRTHTSAHQAQLLQKGFTKVLVVGDVYRKDEIDSTHYPVFHQVEGVCVYPESPDPKLQLWAKMGELIKTLMPNTEMRRTESYFPFTQSSWEYEVKWEGKWLEVAGCGIIHPEILKVSNLGGVGWAFGMGLERIAMALWGIPDIRLFWTEDPRFLEQFRDIQPGFKFQPYSSHPACHKDIAFWVDGEFSPGEFYQMVRDVAGDWVESVKEVDQFTNRNGRKSICYRISYRAMNRTLTNEEVNLLQEQVRGNMKKFNVELR